MQKHVVLPGVEDLENGVESLRVVVSFDEVLGFSVVVGTAPEVLVGFCEIMVVFMVFTVTAVLVGSLVTLVVVEDSFLNIVEV